MNCLIRLFKNLLVKGPAGCNKIDLIVLCSEITDKLIIYDFNLT